MLFQTDWCRHEESRCESCPFSDLDLGAVAVGEQTLAIVDTWGLKAVARNVYDQEINADSTDFDVMVDLTGTAIGTYETEHTTGNSIAKLLIKTIANNHLN